MDGGTRIFFIRRLLYTTRAAVRRAVARRNARAGLTSLLTRAQAAAAEAPPMTTLRSIYRHLHPAPRSRNDGLRTKPCANQQGAPFDVLIRGATVIDGTGGPPQHADVAISNGRIAAIGTNVGAAKTTVDGTGQVLAPGIIDSHTHYDAQITWDPTCSPSTELGVTSVIMGNCGFCVAPCRPSDRDLTLRNLTQVEGMSLEALRTGVRWDFETFGEYMDSVERHGVVPNCAVYCGHSTVRTWVLGQDAASRAATAEEVSAMEELVRDAMAHGALGLSSTTNPQHNGERGIPMPSRMAGPEFTPSGETDEIVRLVSASRMFMLTKGPATPIPYLADLAEKTDKVITTACMFHSASHPNSTFDELAQIDEAKARGVSLWGQVSPAPLNMEFSLASPYPFEGLKAWQAQAMPLVLDRLAYSRLLADAGWRAAVKAELQLRQNGLTDLLTDENWSNILLAEAPAADSRLVGQSVAALATQAGKHPLDFMLDYSLEHDLTPVFFIQLLNSDLASAGRVISHPRMTIACSDAGAHLTFLCDADFGLQVLGPWVRDRSLCALNALQHLSLQLLHVIRSHSNHLSLYIHSLVYSSLVFHASG